VLRLIVFGARKMNATKGAVSVRLVGRQRDRFACFISAARKFAIGEFRPAQNRLRVKRFGQQSPRHGIVRIQFYRLGDQLAETPVYRARRCMAEGAGAQYEVEGVGIRLWLVERSPAFDQGDVSGQRARDPTRDGVLKLKNIGKLAIEAIAPQDRSACRKSNTHIQMMESAKKWRRHNATNGMYCSRDRRVLVD
jgi:hypothetical protein